MKNLKPRQAYESVTIEVGTPTVPSLFVTVVEDQNKEPIAVNITAGKSGGEVSALVSAMSAMMTEYLNTEGNRGITGLIELLSGNKASKYRVIAGGVKISSVPEGITWALLRYRDVSFDDLKRRLGIEEEDEDERPRLIR